MSGVLVHVTDKVTNVKSLSLKRRQSATLLLILLSGGQLNTYQLAHFGVLTYMSINDEILDRVKRGMLFPVLPRARPFYSEAYPALAK
jgi:hypothetical protein